MTTGLVTAPASTRPEDAGAEARREKLYMTLWRNKFLTIDAKCIGEMAQMLEGAAQQLRDMERDGVGLIGGTGDDYAQLVTDDPEVARKYDFDEIEDEEDVGDEE